MPDPTLGEIMDALASQIDVQIGSAGTSDPLIENLQVESRLVSNPTPPSIDIYPADPFMEALAYGKGNKRLNFTVRVRVSTAEQEGGQDLLLSMMDPRSPTSVELAILTDSTLAGKVEDLVVTGPSAFGIFPDAGPNSGALLGCVWTVGVLP